jgi:hypothetical protein
MMKVAPQNDKYFLRSLHQEIDLLDRKLAHLDKYVDFANSADREEAEGKLLQKRATLEKKARELASAGVEFSEADLPDLSVLMPVGRSLSLSTK